MRVYQGKLNTNTSYATKDEVITLSTSGGFRKGSTAVITGQWTESHKGNPKANYSMSGTITKLGMTEIELYVGENQYYWFIGTYSEDKLVLNMKSPELDNYGKAELTLKHSET